MNSNDNNIIVLTFPECIRRRPGMYIGSTNEPSNLLREVIDNSVDELMRPTDKGGIATKCIIQCNEETGECIVGDDGRGIPNLMDTELGIPKLELAMAHIHAGSKFDIGKVASAGMNGCGVKAVNALSSVFEVWSDGLHIVWNRGIKVSEDTDWKLPEGFEDLNTVTRFIPDSQIFKSIIPKIPRENLKYTKLICSELGKSDIHFIVNGEEDTSSLELPKFNIKYGSVWTDLEGNKFPYDLSVYFDWEIGRTYPIFDGTVNGVHTPEGYHINWNRNQLKNILSQRLKIGDSNLILLGLNMFVCVIASEVSYDSQTKVRLSDIKGFDSTVCLPVFQSELDRIINENKEFFSKLKQSTDIYMDSQKRAAEVREIGNLLKGTMNMNPKKADRIKSKLSATGVKDCTTTDRRKAELFIVEGRSAAGNMIKGRNVNIHSILPLRGRPLSAFKCGYQEVLRNNEWLNFILTVGGGIDKLCDVSKVRYGKVIISSDSDPDGMAIAISLLGGIGTHMRYLIENGLVYVLETPLYLDTRTNTYYYLGDESKLDFSSGKIRRFKGLGEFCANQFKDFAFNQDKRRLIKVTMDNIDDALELIRNTGSKKNLMLSEGFLSDEVITESMFDSIKFQHS